MWGAIIGDIVGSRYEWKPIKTKEFQLFGPRCSYTDDSVCTVAVAAILMDDLPPTPTLQDWCRRHRWRGYGGFFADWIESSEPAPYGSYGNGAAMRVSPAAYLNQSRPLEMALKAANDVTAITHDHPEGMKGAQATTHASVSSWRRTGAPRASKRGRESAKSLRTSCSAATRASRSSPSNAHFASTGARCGARTTSSRGTQTGRSTEPRPGSRCSPPRRCDERWVPFVDLPGQCAPDEGGDKGAARGWLLGGVVGALQCAAQDSANGGVSCCCRPVLAVAATVDGVTDQLQGGRTCTL